MRDFNDLVKEAIEEMFLCGHIEIITDYDGKSIDTMVYIDGERVLFRKSPIKQEGKHE